MPIALGKYLFPFRTQKSSPVAPIILQQRETRKVPNYRVGLSHEKAPTKELRKKNKLEVNSNLFFVYDNSLHELGCSIFTEHPYYEVYTLLITGMTIGVWPVASKRIWVTSSLISSFSTFISGSVEIDLSVFCRT